MSTARHGRYAPKKMDGLGNLRKGKGERRGRQLVLRLLLRPLSVAQLSQRDFASRKFSQAKCSAAQRNSSNLNLLSCRGRLVGPECADLSWLIADCRCWQERLRSSAPGFGTLTRRPFATCCCCCLPSGRPLLTETRPCSSESTPTRMLSAAGSSTVALSSLQYTVTWYLVHVAVGLCGLFFSCIKLASRSFVMNACSATC